MKLLNHMFSFHVNTARAVLDKGISDDRWNILNEIDTQLPGLKYLLLLDGICKLFTISTLLMAT